MDWVIYIYTLYTTEQEKKYHKFVIGCACLHKTRNIVCVFVIGFECKTNGFYRTYKDVSKENGNWIGLNWIVLERKENKRLGWPTIDMLLCH